MTVVIMTLAGNEDSPGPFDSPLPNRSIIQGIIPPDMIVMA